VDKPLIDLRDGLPVTFVIDIRVEQYVFVAIRIPRCIHGLGNDVQGEFTNITIIKFNAINV
jgi:hypothetical protein